MKSMGVTLQSTYLTKNCKKKHCDIQLSCLADGPIVSTPLPFLPGGWGGEGGLARNSGEGVFEWEG